MKPTILAATLAALLGLSGCSTTTESTSQTASSNKVFSQEYVLEELDNGLRVMIVKTDYPDVVSLQIPVSVGSRDEVEAGKTGFAHFLNT